MHVKIGNIIIQEIRLNYVTNLGMGFPGFEFKGHALEDTGRRIVNGLDAIRQEGVPVDCEARTKEGHLLADLGKLENFEYKASDTAPVRYSFSGRVSFPKV